MKRHENPNNEKLVKELYERLNWYTYEASDEEFDFEEIKAVIQLLDVLDPIRMSPEEEEYFSPDAAFERFKKRCNITNPDDDNGGAELSDCGSVICGSKEDAVGKIRDFSEAKKRRNSGADSETAQELFPYDEMEKFLQWKKEQDASSQKENEKHSFTLQSPLAKTTAAIAIVVTTFLLLNIGSYAVAEKSFFEVVGDGVNGFHITTNGGAEESRGFEDDASERRNYATWEEMEKEEGVSVLKPKNLSDGMELEELYVREENSYEAVIANFKGEAYELKMVICDYNNEYRKQWLGKCEDEKEIKVEEISYKEEKYYEVENGYAAIFVDNNKMYYIFTDGNFEKLQKIVYSM